MITSTCNLYISGRNPVYCHDDLTRPQGPSSASAALNRSGQLSIRTQNSSPALMIAEDILPRLSAVKSKADDFLHHLDVLKEATRMKIASSLLDNRHARLPKSEKVLLLESLVERGREVGDGRPLDQLVESALDDIRGSWADGASQPLSSDIPVTPPKPRPNSAQVKTAPNSSSTVVPRRTRNYDDGETEQALKSLEAFKNKIRKMKAQGLKVDTVLDEPSIFKQKPLITSRHGAKSANSRADLLEDRSDSPCPPPSTPLAAWELEPPAKGKEKSSTSTSRDRLQAGKSPMAQDDDDEAHMKFRFIARPVPPSSLVPKYDKIMRQAEERRKQRVQKGKHELQGKVRPFAFEYSSMLQKRKEAAKAKHATKTNPVKRKSPPPRPKSAPASPLRTSKPPPPSSHDPTPDHTFHPRINPTVPDFAASHMHFSSLLARSRKAHAPLTPRPFRGIEMRQRMFEERKKRTIARVMTELNKDEHEGWPPTGVGKRAPVVKAETRRKSVATSAPKTTRATELTLAARKAKEAARAKRAEDERMAQAHRAAKEAAMAAVIREAMESSERKRIVKSVAVGRREDREEGVRARLQMARATREYASFLEAMEARLNARPLTLEQVGGAEVPSIREQATKIAEEKIAKILAQLEHDSTLAGK